MGPECLSGSGGRIPSSRHLSFRLWVSVSLPSFFSLPLSPSLSLPLSLSLSLYLSLSLPPPPPPTLARAPACAFVCVCVCVCVYCVSVTEPESQRETWWVGGGGILWAGEQAPSPPGRLPILSSPRQELSGLTTRPPAPCPGLLWGRVALERPPGGPDALLLHAGRSAWGWRKGEGGGGGREGRPDPGLGWAGPRSAGGSGEREPGALTPPGPRPPTPAQLRVSERPVDCRAQTGLPSAPRPGMAWESGETSTTLRVPEASGPLGRQRAAWAEAPAEGQAKRQAARRPGGPEARRRGGGLLGRRAAPSSVYGHTTLNAPDLV